PSTTHLPYTTLFRSPARSGLHGSRQAIDDPAVYDGTRRAPAQTLAAPWRVPAFRQERPRIDLPLLLGIEHCDVSHSARPQRPARDRKSTRLNSSHVK